MLTTSASSSRRRGHLGRPLQARDVVSALVDVLIMVEPLQLQLWKAAGLTFAQLRVLRLLKESPASPGTLAEMSGVAAPSMTRVLTRLQERGLVDRQVDSSDRRRYEVSITREGLDTLSGNRIWANSPFRRAAAEMTYEERRAFLTSVQKYLKRVREHTDTAEYGILPAAHRSVSAQ